MAEETLFEGPGVRITTARAIIAGNTYAMAQVTSVSTVTMPPKRLTGLVMMMLVGLIAVICGCGASEGIAGLLTIGGGSFLLVGIVVVVLAKRKYALVLGTAGGDKQALVTPDRDLVGTIRHAVEEAIIRRG